MLSKINSTFFGPLLPIVLAVSAVFLFIKLKGKPLTNPKKSALSIFRSKDSFKALCLSLSGTLGVGNIAGVAAAISVGGAGSIFWMWVFGILAMIIKYSEVVLAMKYRTQKNGGSADYMEHGLKSRALGIVFSILVIISSIGVGNTVQSSAAAESMLFCFGIPKIFTGILFALLTLIMISGGIKRVQSFSVAVIPILTVGYIIFSVSIVAINIHLLPFVFKRIFTEAFDMTSLGGGLFGFAMVRAMRLGASRGILSNEAGCGTATYAHSSTDQIPAYQGIWGMIEVFIDTIVLCTLTALVVLITVPNTSGNSNGMEIAIEAYSYFGKLGGDFIGISSAFYALASVICWSYYGISAVKYMGGKKISCGLYVTTYSAAGVLGSIFTASFIWELSDFSISLMAIFNTICILLLSKKVKEETDKCF